MLKDGKCFREFCWACSLATITAPYDWPSQPIKEVSMENTQSSSPWVIDGLAFPHDTKFRGLYKGYYYSGRVREGALMLDDKAFVSPCAAAITITRNSVDGWLFWDCKLPGQTCWKSIYELKQENTS
jgi:hypothetical protein